VDGLTALQVQHTDYQVLSTPQLHYLVRCINTRDTNDAYGEVSENGYYSKLAQAFIQLVVSSE
jgi:phosphoacetylglucosamine mutase